MRRKTKILLGLGALVTVMIVARLIAPGDALLHGRIVSEIQLLSPKFNILAEPTPETKGEEHAKQREKERLAKGQETSWQTQVKQLVPLEINRIGIQAGEFHLRDLHSEPKVDVPVRDIAGEVTNLTNSENMSEDMVAHADFRANST